MTVELWALLVLAIAAVLCAGYCCIAMASMQDEDQED